MNKIFLIIIFTLFALGILYGIKSPASQPTTTATEKFTNNIINEIDMVPERTAKSTSDIDVNPDRFIIARDDKIIENKITEIDVVDPVPTNPVVLPNQAFKDNLFVRDAGVNNMMAKLNNITKDNYVDAAQSHATFIIPRDSKDALEYKQYSDIPKDITTLADIHDMMVGKVNENISKDEIDRITGKPITFDQLNNMYKPVFVSMDPDYTGEMFKNIPYKFNGYDKIPFGSMI
jgi:hypothetical protein